jgi:hypothetical protein
MDTLSVATTAAIGGGVGGVCLIGLVIVISLAVCRRKRANGAGPGPVAAVGDVPMGTLPPSPSSSSVYRELRLSEQSLEASLPASSVYGELQLSNSNSKQSSTVYAATGLHSSSALPYTAAPTQAATPAADLYVSGEVERVEVEVEANRAVETSTLPYLPFPKLDQET